MSSHKIKWWVYVGRSGHEDRERIPRTAGMAGRWEYDVTCSCGWDSRTGGAVKSYVTRAVQEHKWHATFDQDM